MSSFSEKRGGEPILWGDIEEREAILEAAKLSRKVTWGEPEKEYLEEKEGDKGEVETDAVEKWEIVNASAGYLYLAVTLNERRVYALIDSGSKHSIMSYRLWRQIETKEGLTQCAVNLKAAGGNKLRVRGETTQRLVIGDEGVTVSLIVADILEELIIGSDFLTKGSARLDFLNLTLEIGGREIPLVKIKEGTCKNKAQVCLSKDSEVGRQGVLRCKVEGGVKLPGTFRYRPRSVMDYEGGPILVNVCESEIEVEVESKTPDVMIQFSEGDVLGELEEVDEMFWKENEDSRNWPRAMRVKEIYKNLKVEENEHLTERQRLRCKDLIEEYHDVFSLSDKELGLTDLYVHKIKLKDDRAIIHKNRPIPMHSFETAKKMISDLVELGVLEPSNAVHRSPLLLVDKANSSKKRLVIDFRCMNEVTEDSPHPMPTMMEARNTWAGCKFWSVLDLSMAYFQVPLAEESKDITTIWCSGLGSFRFCRVPMGGKTSGAALQALTDRLFGDLKKTVVNNYLDDFVTGARDFEGMMENLAVIFERLRLGKLKIKSEKCEIFKKEVKFLGMRLNEEGLWANEAKIKSLLDMAPPKSRKDVQRFCGLMNFFREFIPNLAEKARGLTNLLKCEGKFEFTEEAKKSFEEIKVALTSPPCLAWADEEKEFHLYTDSSNSCIGYCLMQHDAEGKLHPVFYGSKCLGKSQLIWPSFCKEFYAAFVAITRLRYYLYGKKFTLYTDCQSLSYSKTMKKSTSNAILRWAIELSSYTFDIKYIPGKKNVVSDTLSRLPPMSELKALPKRSRELYDYFKGEARRHFSRNKDDGEDDEEDEGNRVKTRGGSEEEKGEGDDGINFVESSPEGVTRGGKLMDEKFIMTCQGDKVLSKVKEWVSSKQRVKEPMKLEISLRRYHNKLDRLILNEEGLVCMLYYHPQKRKSVKLVCVPEELIEEVMRVHHEVVSGHLAAEKTMSSILQTFYFPNMQEQVRLYCKTCSQCFKTNLAYKKAESTKLKPVMYNYPGICVAMDVVMVQKGKKDSKILTVTDKFTKWCGFYPIRDEKANTIALTFLEKWVSVWSVPEILITDNALSFKASEVMNTLYQLLAIEKRYCSPYHPEGNGECERRNKVLLHMLQKLVDEFPQKWKKLLPLLQLAVNGAQNRSTGFSAFKLMTGREMRGLENVIFDIRNTEYYQSEAHLVNETYKEMRKVFQIASENLEVSYSLQKKVYDKNRSHVELEVGDRVLLYRPKDTSNAFHKLTTEWNGPHAILKVYDEHNYLIREEEGEKEQIVHRNHLRKLPEGMRGSLAKGSSEKGVGEESGRIAKELDKGPDETGKRPSDTESSEQDSDSDGDYYYVDKGKGELGIERTTDVKQFERPREVRNIPHNAPILEKRRASGDMSQQETREGRDRREDQKEPSHRNTPHIPLEDGYSNIGCETLDFWEVSEESEGDTDKESGSVTPEINEPVRGLLFKKPRYTEFQGVQEHEGKLIVSGTRDQINPTLEDEEEEEEEERNTGFLEAVERTVQEDDQLRIGEMVSREDSHFQALEQTAEELRGKGAKEAPAKDNFTRPSAASSPKPSALIPDMRRLDQKIQQACNRMSKCLEEGPAKGEAEATRSLEEGYRKSEKRGRGLKWKKGEFLRRSERNKGKAKVNYYKEINPTQ